MYSLALSWWAGLFFAFCAFFSFVLAHGSPLYTSCILLGALCAFFFMKYLALLIHQKK